MSSKKIYRKGGLTNYKETCGGLFYSCWVQIKGHISKITKNPTKYNISILGYTDESTCIKCQNSKTNGSISKWKGLVFRKLYS